MKKLLLTLACTFLLTGCLAPKVEKEQDNTPNENETPSNENNEGQNNN